MAEIFGRLAGIISLIAFVPYIVSILRGKTKPNRATWWIWTVVGCMLAASYYLSGAKETIWVPVSYLVGPLATSLLSLKFGEGGWTRFDRWCLFGAGASLVLWLAFSSPLIALLINLFIDFLGALPTIRKVYFDQKSEDPIAWGLFFVGNTCNLFAIGSFDFAIVVYPIWMFLGSGAVAMLLLIPRKKCGIVDNNEIRDNG